MITIRRSDVRGHVNHGWLDTYHAFSFASYHDPAHMGFGVLRVINEDRIAPSTGFPTHGHENMEIISYVVEGALSHKDSMGNESTIRPGEVQRMSAGTGVRHSEYNHEKNTATHLLQIWFLPSVEGIAPSYEQKSFDSDFAQGNFVLVASESGRDGSVTMHQDVDMYVVKSNVAGEKHYAIRRDRNIWVQVIRGEVEMEGELLQAGDGAAITQVLHLDLKWKANTEFLLFDLP